MGATSYLTDGSVEVLECQICKKKIRCSSHASLDVVMHMQQEHPAHMRQSFTSNRYSSQQNNWQDFMNSLEKIAKPPTHSRGHASKGQASSKIPRAHPHDKQAISPGQLINKQRPASNFLSPQQGISARKVTWAPDIKDKAASFPRSYPYEGRKTLIHDRPSIPLRPTVPNNSNSQQDKGIRQRPTVPNNFKPQQDKGMRHRPTVLNNSKPQQDNGMHHRPTVLNNSKPQQEKDMRHRPTAPNNSKPQQNKEKQTLADGQQTKSRKEKGVRDDFNAPLKIGQNVHSHSQIYPNLEAPCVCNAKPNNCNEHETPNNSQMHPKCFEGTFNASPGHLSDEQSSVRTRCAAGALNDYVSPTDIRGYFRDRDPDSFYNGIGSMDSSDFTHRCSRYWDCIELWRPYSNQPIYCPRCCANKRPLIRNQRNCQHKSVSEAICDVLCGNYFFKEPKMRKMSLYCAECYRFLGAFYVKTQGFRPNRAFTGNWKHDRTVRLAT